MVNMKATETGSGGDVGRAVMERFWQATEARDLETLFKLVHPDVHVHWPQSGERFSGRDNAMAALEAAAVKPEVAGEPRLLGCGDVWVASVPLRYGSEVNHYVGVFELEDGLIRRTTEYFGAPFAPNPARAGFANQE
jgi:hypothetical protein